VSNWKTVLSDWSGYALTLVLGFVSVPSASVLIENIYNYIAASISAGASPIGAPPAWLLLALSVIGSLLGHALGISHVQVKKALRLKGLIKMLALFAFFAMVGTASAYEWNIPANQVRFSQSTLKSLALNKKLTAGTSETDIITAPTAALACGTVKSSYGFSFSYAVLVGKISYVNDTTSNYSNYFGLGVSGYADLGNFMTTDYSIKDTFKGGFNAILPEMCGVTPGVSEVWAYKQKPTFLVTANVPLGSTHKVCKVH
jgi:hypothetical protein